MTKYEEAKIIGVRAEQIARGGVPYVDINDVDGARFDPRDVARRELAAGVLPFKVVRMLPDGSREEWSLKDLILPS